MKTRWKRVDLIKTLRSYNPVYRYSISGKSEMIEIEKKSSFSSSCEWSLLICKRNSFFNLMCSYYCKTSTNQNFFVIGHRQMKVIKYFISCTFISSKFYIHITSYVTKNFNSCIVFIIYSCFKHPKMSITRHKKKQFYQEAYNKTKRPCFIVHWLLYWHALLLTSNWIYVLTYIERTFDFLRGVKSFSRMPWHVLFLECVHAD